MQSSMVVLKAAKESLASLLEPPKLTIAQLHLLTSKYQPLQEGVLWEGLADGYDKGLCDAVSISERLATDQPVQLQKVACFFEQ